MAEQTKINQSTSPLQIGEQDTTLRLIAFIFATINTVVLGLAECAMLLLTLLTFLTTTPSSTAIGVIVGEFLIILFLIPLAWMIPMTVHTYKIYKGIKSNTIAFGVCSLIFLNLISGILLLCSKKDN